jgi:acyl-coenzyme A thioesterase PaaI-like protein
MNEIETSETWHRVFNDGFTAFIGAVERLSLNGVPQETLRFQLEPHHMGPDGVSSRGLLMALMDTMLWAVTLETLYGSLTPPTGQGATTVSLNADFLGTATAGEIVYGVGEITRRTRSIVFISGRLFTRNPDGSERGLLSALGVWKILGA